VTDSKRTSDLKDALRAERLREKAEQRAWREEQARLCEEWNSMTRRQPRVGELEPDEDDRAV
jgi:hypothetical protein